MIERLLEIIESAAADGNTNAREFLREHANNVREYGRAMGELLELLDEEGSVTGSGLRDTITRILMEVE